MEVEKKNKQITKNLRVMCVQQQIIQEQGERYFNDQRDRRIIAETERLEDELHRESLKQKIEYFQVGSDQDKAQDFKHFENKWQRDERERMERKATRPNEKKVVGYSFNYPIEFTKNKVWKMLNASKHGSDKKPSLNTTSPLKTGRPRANSQENILQSIDEGGQKSNIYETPMLMQNRGYSREPLSQFVCHQMKDITSDTQSEDSMGAEIKNQMEREKQLVNNERDKEQEDPFAI